MPGETDASRDAVDHYRLLQVDPDAPQALVAEAYWYLARKLRAELPVRRSAERELLALNTAYAALAVAEQRRAYDATVSRVIGDPARARRKGTSPDRTTAADSPV